MRDAAAEHQPPYLDARMAQGNRRKRAAFPCVLGITVALLVGGCIQDKFTSLHIVNDTTGPISVMYVHNGSRLLAKAIPAGAVSSIDDPFTDTGDCSAGILVATSADGTELARRTERICIGDTWRVPALPAPSASVTR